MAQSVIMPQGGQDIDKGMVVRWLKTEKEAVKKGEVICEVETEKAVFEVTAPIDGYLLKIIVPAGSEAAILSPIGVVGRLEEAVEIHQIDTVSPTISIGDISSGEAPKMVETISSIQLEQDKVKISPKAKRIALDKGVPYQKIIGTGPLGRIVEKDILAYIGQTKSQPVKSAKVESREGKRIVSMTKARKVIARRMQQSKQTVPHFYVTVSVDMTAALQFRMEFNNLIANSQEQGLSITDLIVKACAIALKEIPELNSSYMDEDHIIIWEDINIGIAVATEAGLIVPVLEKADTMTLDQITQQTKKMIEAAREGKQISLTPGRFTISNLGMFDVSNFVAIINAPEAAILAVSGVEKRVVPLDNTSIGIRDFMNVTLSVDHRVGDGVLAAQFLNKVKTLLEAPKSLM